MQQNTFQEKGSTQSRRGALAIMPTDGRKLGEIQPKKTSLKMNLIPPAYLKTKIPALALGCMGDMVKPKFLNFPGATNTGMTTSLSTRWAAFHPEP
jgi:hypothetical protein